MNPSPLDLEELEHRGYTTIGLVNRRQLRGLARTWRKLAVARDENYYASSVHAERSVARAVDQELKSSLDAHLDRLLPASDSFLAAFISKGAHGGHVDLHPDWTYCDERIGRAYVFWCPLVDTDAANGTMQVLPGTHRALTGLRGSGDFPSPIAELDDTTVAEHTVSVPLEAGEAIVWDAALVHGSGPNTTDDPRPAVAIARAPADADLYHFHIDDDGVLGGYQITERYFTTEEFGTAPQAGDPIEPWDGPVRPLSAEDLHRTG